MIRNIIFDMGHVLFKFDRDVLLSRHAPDATKEERELLRREIYLSGEWIMQDRGTLTPQQSCEIFQSRLPAHLRGCVEGLVRHWDEDIIPVEGMAQLVRELKDKGYGIFLLSNAALDHPDYWPRVPGSEYFDDVCVSAFEGYIKPQPEIYERAIRKFCIVPAESVFIDDVPANIEAAFNAGMAGIVFHDDVRELRRKLRELGIACEG